MAWYLVLPGARLHVLVIRVGASGGDAEFGLHLGQRILAGGTGSDGGGDERASARGEREVRVRAALGADELRCGEPVAERAPILRRYLQQVPGGRPHMPVAPDAPLAEFEAVAARYPAFRVVDDRP